MAFENALAFASMALSESVQAGRLMKAIKEAADDQTIRTLSDHGRAYDNFKQWKQNRAILAPGDAYDKYTEESDESKLPCVSPFVENFQDLYARETRPSTTYVLYDKSGKGKSMGAIALLKDFYLLEENTELQGIMIQPQQDGGDYMESVASLLKASNVEGWLNLLLFVLNEKPRTKKPSLLVLDDFFFDEEGRNKRFISRIYNTLKRAQSERYNIIVVVITKEKHVADCLCSMNGGERIQPMVGRYETKENDVLFKAQCALKLADERQPLTNPTWKLVRWTKDLLIEAVKYEFPESELESISYDFIEDGMTPLQVCGMVAAKLQAGTGRWPVSPRRRGQFFEPDSSGGRAQQSRLPVYRQ